MSFLLFIAGLGVGFGVAIAFLILFPTGQKEEDLGKMVDMLFKKYEEYIGIDTEEVNDR